MDVPSTLLPPPIPQGNTLYNFLPEIKILDRILVVRSITHTSHTQTPQHSLIELYKKFLYPGGNKAARSDWSTWQFISSTSHASDWSTWQFISSTQHALNGLVPRAQRKTYKNLGKALEQGNVCWKQSIADIQFLEQNQLLWAISSTLDI